MAINVLENLSEPRCDLTHFLTKVLPNDQKVKFLFVMKRDERFHRGFSDIKLMAEEALRLSGKGYDVYFA